MMFTATSLTVCVPFPTLSRLCRTRVALLQRADTCAWYVPVAGLLQVAQMLEWPPDLLVAGSLNSRLAPSSP